MFTAILIGNIGGDAELHNENGNKFVTFRVADTQRFKGSDGQTRETTNWVSCILNGDGGNLLQHLVKGQKVCVIGDQTLRTYHSKAQRALVAGASIFVRQVELVGAKPDVVPGYLFREDGTQVNVRKYYYAAEVANLDSVSLFDRNKVEYKVQEGWVAPHEATQQDGEQTAETTEATEQADDAPFTDTYGQQAENEEKTTEKS